MTFNDYINRPQSKKITLVEIDSPISANWINYQSGIWFTRLTPGSQEFEDDNGNFAYWQGQNDQYYNIQSLNVDGEQYSEVSTLALCISTNKSWFYDTSTTDFYIHLDDWAQPGEFFLISPGAAIGFSNQVDNTTNNYYEDIYYEPLVKSVPNLSKKKDSLFFGILQYQGGSISFDNTGGYFDDFASRDLYGQPIRIYLSFEGLDYSEAKLVYTGKVEDFKHDLTTFTLQVADIRKLLSRSLPVNRFDTTAYPDIDSRLVGTPIPIAYGPVINAPAYKVTDTGGTETWVFCDTTFNAVDSGISVVDKDGVAVTHAGTETDGTFTSTSTDRELYVSFTVSAVQNGLDVIADVLENYEDIAFSAANYDLTEWNAEKLAAYNTGLWIGKGNELTSVDVIEQICVDNQGIFDVLADGRFTFRTYNPDKLALFELYEDELLDDPVVDYDSEEYLSSATIAHSKDWLSKNFETYTDDSQEQEVYARYRQYKDFSKPLETSLTSIDDATTLAADIMEQSSFIYPKIQLTTKTQNIELRILDNALYHAERQSGKSIIDRSAYQILGLTLDMSSYEIAISGKQIKPESDIYVILDGGDSTTDYDYYDGGTSATANGNIIDGGDA